MTIIEKIILDKEWNQIMSRIDKLSLEPRANVSFECYHGFSHALAVARYAEDILQQLGNNSGGLFWA